MYGLIQGGQTVQKTKCTDCIYTGHIFDIYWAYFGNILSISWAYLRHIVDIFLSYIRHILGVSVTKGHRMLSKNTKCYQKLLKVTKSWHKLPQVLPKVGKSYQQLAKVTKSYQKCQNTKVTNFLSNLFSVWFVYHELLKFCLVPTICLPYGLSTLNQSAQLFSIQFVQCPYNLSSIQFVCRPSLNGGDMRRV